jgi:hypothetical protein
VALADALGVSVDYLVRDETTTPMLDHRAYLGSPSDLEDAVLSAVRRAVDTGHAVLVVTTRPAAGAFRKAVRAHGDVAVESTSEWYTTPPEVMGRFRAFVTTAREDGAEWVQILTEPPREWAGLEPAETRAWLRAESLINMSLAPWPVTLGCLYDAGTVPARVRTSLERTHPEVVATSNGHPRPAYERPEYFLTR